MSVYPTPREFTKVNLELTTACNLACPDCAAATNGSGLRKVVHHPLAYFVEAAKWLHGIDSCIVIGGEPTSHPKFAEIVSKLRELFGCRELVLWTNGFRTGKYADLIKRTFDAVYASIYDAESGHEWNKKPNRESVNLIHPDAIAAAPHVPWAKRGSGKICERGIHGPITYADGKIYGCCVAMAIPTGIGVEPGPNWRAEVLATPLPCANCCFSPAE